MDLASLVPAGLLKYSDYLMNWGERIKLDDPPKHNPNTERDYVHASKLGLCPLKVHKERNKHARTYTPTDAQRLRGGMKIRMGMMVGEFVAEALHYAYQWKYEVRIGDPAFRVKGRIDVLAEHNGKQAVIEVKKKEPFGKSNIPTPAYYNVLQTMAYMMLTGYPGYILTFPSDYMLFMEDGIWRDYHTWEIKPEGSGYVVVNAHGDEWEHKYNSPKYLNFDALRAEISRHRAYLSGAETDVPKTPISDEGWECAEKVDTDKWKAPYYITPACPFFGDCHTMQPGPFLVESVEGQKFINWGDDEL